MIIAMKAVHFNSSTIEALMESLYELNKKLLVREGLLSLTIFYLTHRETPLVPQLLMN